MAKLIELAITGETIISVAKVIGIDLNKSTFHLIAHDYSGREIFRHKYSRAKIVDFLSVQESTIITMAACCGAHWLAKKCKEFGHEVKLIPAQYVKPYVKTHRMITLMQMQQGQT